MELHQLVQNHKVKISSVDINALNPHPFYDRLAVQSLIALELTKNILKSTGATIVTPESTHSDYELKATNNGILVLKDDNYELDFDIIADHNSTRYIVEVKSNKLNGFTKKIGKYHDLAQQLFPEHQTHLLIFFPAYHARKDILSEITNERTTPADLGYTSKQIKNAVSGFYRLKRNDLKPPKRKRGRLY